MKRRPIAESAVAVATDADAVTGASMGRGGPAGSGPVGLSVGEAAVPATADPAGAVDRIGATAELAATDGGRVTADQAVANGGGEPAELAVADGSGEAAAPVRPRSSVMMDVARLAGVSHQTVSRVLNDHTNVRAQTRERVLAAMRELDYQPNSAARTLVTRRSNIIGIVTVDSTLFGPASMVYEIEQAARAAGYFVSIASISTMSRQPGDALFSAEPAESTVLEAVNRLRAQGLEGIVAIIPEESGVAALASATTGIVTVAVGVGDGAEVPIVGMDNLGGGALATEHLLGLGHRTVHHVAGPAGQPESRDRQLGWSRSLAAVGAPIPAVLPGDWSPRSGYEMGQRLADDPELTAVFCANDQMALGVLRALSEVGRRVPAEVSVVGFDDIPEAPFMIPPLTTVRQDFAEVGRRSLRLFIDLVTGVRPPGQITIRLTPQLQVRQSSGPPPLSRR